MRKFTAGVCALVLAAMPAMTALAAPSIGSEGPKDPTAASGVLTPGETLIIQDAATEDYADANVADVINRFNDKDSVMSVLDVNNDVMLDLSAEVTSDLQDLESNEKLTVANVGAVAYEKEEVASIVADFNKAFGTFQKEVSETGETIYTASSKTIGDLLLDAAFVAETAPTTEDLKDGQTLVLKNSDSDRYASKDVKKAVEDFNNSRKNVTAEDVANALGAKDANLLNGYNALTKFMDLAVEEDDELSFTSDKLTATLTIGTAKGQKAEDLVLVLIDPETGDLYYFTPDEFDEETGEMTVTLPRTGVLAVLTKAEVAETTAETNKGTEIAPADYKSLTPFADLVIEKDDEYELRETGEFTATLTFNSLKDMDQEDLLIVMIDPEDGTVSYIEPDEFDPETGAVTASFTHLGAFTIASKAELEEVPEETNKGNVVLPQEYDSLMPFVDLALEKNEKVTYDMDGNVQVTFTSEYTIGMDADQLLILTIDQETREKKYLEFDEFDPKTGEITATFENLGPFTIIGTFEDEEEDAETETEAESEAETEEETETSAQ